MASVLIVLLVLVGLVALYLDRNRGRRGPARPVAGQLPDHDTERQLAELRGLRGYREDPPLFG
ncbi:MAG: hypothetical protein AB7J32_15250 [Pseudonocardia sp.]